MKVLWLQMCLDMLDPDDSKSKVVHLDDTNNLCVEYYLIQDRLNTSASTSSSSGVIHHVES
jgi:hypothetical protein